MIFNASAVFSPFAGKNRVKAATKMLRVMKLTALLLFIASLHVSAHGLAQDRITFSGKEVPLEKVFSAIKKQTNYTFLYRDDVLQNGQKVTINVKNASIEDVMELCVKGQPFGYLIKGKSIFIINKDDAPKAKPHVVSSLNNRIDVKGRVMDENKAPIIGANVIVKGTNKGTSTDENGYFSLVAIDEKAILVITRVGYARLEINCTSNSIINITMKQLVSQLDETVVIGYGQTTKRFNTGSVSRVTSNTITEQPVSNPLTALEGRVPGLYISQNTGMPGGGVAIQLRGQNNLAGGNDPLFIIDGVPFSSTPISSSDLSNGIIPNASPFSFFNPADIESVEVLKDADATAIYGSRGANGVILITTKKGKAGKTKVDLNVYTGYGKITRTMELLNTQQYLQMRHEAFANDGASIGPTDYDLNGKWDTTRYSDWQKTLLGGTAHYSDAQLNISGGSANTSFVIGGGYHSETTVFSRNFSDQKLFTHFNLTHSSTDQRFKVALSASYLSDKNRLPRTDLTSNALTAAPDAPAIYDSLGNLNWQNATFFNPISKLLQKYKGNSDNLLTNAVFSYHILPGLQIKTSLGYTTLNTNEIATVPFASLYPAIPARVRRRLAFFSTGRSNSWIVEPQVNWYKKQSKGEIEVLAGATLQQSTRQGQTLQALGFTSDASLENLAAASSITISSTAPPYYNQYRYAALFARINYNWDGKYLFNLTGRRDGSSRFGPGNQYANFGAIGGGWIFSRENLVVRHLPFLSYGKLRVSYGTTGNDQIGDYQYLLTYSSTSYPYQGSPGLYPTNLYNPDYQWEITKKWETGLELGFLKDRILFTIDYYRNRTSNQLVGYSLPLLTGFSSIQSNFPALVENTGVEMDLNITSVKTKYFTWNCQANLTVPKNKLVSYPNIEASSYAYTYSVGQSLFIRKAFHYTGVDPTTGVYSFEDVDKDGAISYPNDLTAFKKIAQDFYGGLQNNLQFKNWQLAFFFQFVKQTGRNYLYAPFNAPGFIGNQPSLVMNRWQKPGDQVNIQKFSQDYGSDAYAAFSNATSFGDNTISDASFIRLKNLSLSYQLPDKWRKKMQLQGCRIYIQGQNLITITKYQGLDPENQNNTALPPLRVWTGGIQITL